MSTKRLRARACLFPLPTPPFAFALLSGWSACGPPYNPAREAIDAAKAAAASDVPGGEERWTCPMHVDVRSEQPGPCPACGMALVEEAR